MGKIYHYTKLNILLEHILKNISLRTNSLDKMNDPKENQLWAFSGKEIDYSTIYPDTYTNETHIEHQYKLGNEIRKSVQSISFVKGDNPVGFLNEMMWAHYSENHRGVCLELNLNDLIEENKEILSYGKFENICYGGMIKPTIDWDRDCTKEENIRTISKNYYKELFLSKSNYWEKENEIRLLVFDRESKYLKIKNSLTGIYFGLFMPYSYRPSIDYYLKDMKTRLYDLSYEDNAIKIIERKRNDFRPLITRKYIDI